MIRSVVIQCKTRIAELEQDVESKETERHRACRDYDRLSAFVKQRGGVNTDDVNESDIKSEQAADTEKSREKTASGSSSTEMVKQEALAKKEKEHAKIVATLRENMGILSTKLYQERQKLDSMRRELEKFKALEVAVRACSVRFKCMRNLLAYYWVDVLCLGSGKMTKLRWFKITKKSLTSFEMRKPTATKSIKNFSTKQR